MCRSLIIFLLFITTVPAYSRHIDLDSLYLDSESNLCKKLVSHKNLLYSGAGSRRIDTSVIFALWLNGSDIAYIREFYPVNIVYVYHHRRQHKKELCRIEGVVTTVITDPAGKLIYLKRLLQADDSVPEGEFLVIETEHGKIIHRESSYPFLDFSVTGQGNILLERRNGIFELNPYTGKEKLVYPEKIYKEIKGRGITIACKSPCGKKTLFINGSGGVYRGLLISRHGKSRLHGLTSSSEVFWINTGKFVFRKGYTGNFSAAVYNTSGHRESLLVNNSLNTNLQYSRFAGIVSFLSDGMICIYDTNDNSKHNLLLEGEDVRFSSDRNRFISLYGNNLYISSINIMKRREIASRRECRRILHLYRIILNKKTIHENSYSADYIKRKIAQYSSFESFTARDN